MGETKRGLRVTVEDLEEGMTETLELPRVGFTALGSGTVPVACTCRDAASACGTCLSFGPRNVKFGTLEASGSTQTVNVGNCTPGDPGGSESVCGGMRVVLPLPPSTNNLYATVMRRGKPVRVKSKEGKAFDAIVAHRVLHWCLENGRYAAVPPPPYRLDIWIYPKDRRRDASNFIKATEDAIFAAINRNDRLVVDVRARLGAVDKQNPRAEATLEHVEPATQEV